MRLTEPEQTRPTVNCPVRGHDHLLEYVETIVQDTTGLMLRVLECKDRYRFHYLRGTSEKHGMCRMRRPRWGW